jgi:deazaflavin-dependent oxidoreductase (nitroreductase family)
MNAYQSSMRRLSGISWFRWLLSKVATPLDLRLKNTAFAPSTFGVDFPLCFLTTTGRHSGEPRTVPLYYVKADGIPAVVATNWGTSSHPGWSYNLDAHPEASLEIDEESSQVMARLIPDIETMSVWNQLIEIWPAYAQYREIAQRDIRVYALDPT